ncbi:MAG: peptidyl-prolyl cis-trans isomerase [Vicinamibacteria bacterium]
MKPRTLVLLVPNLILTALLSSPAPGEIVERVVAKVNGEIVTLSDFTARQVQAAQAARVTADRVEQFLRQNNARILQDAIDEVLLLQRAKELGFRMPPEYIADVIENIKKENNITSEEAFQEQLAREGMTVDDLKRSVERSIMTRQVLSREVESKIQVTEADLAADYEARRGEYTKPPAVRLQELLVTSDAGDALEQAQGLVARARAGEDFAELARTYSKAPSRASGGDLGLLNHGELHPDVEKIAFALPPGGVSDPIASGSGYQILRVEARVEGGTTPFEQVKEEIRKRLTSARRADAYEHYLADLRKSAAVDIRVREVPLQVDLPSSGSILDPPDDTLGAPLAAPAAPAAASAPAPPGDDEFRVSPQAAPERVAPASAPAAPAPQPTPTPSPRP